MLGLAMIDLCTKLEISMFTHCENMKYDKNAEIGVVWGGVMGHLRVVAYNTLLLRSSAT